MTKDQKREYDHVRYMSNADARIAESIKHRKENPEARRIIVKRYDTRHKVKRRVYKSIHVLHKYHNDPVYRVLHLCRCRLRCALKSQNLKKSVKTKPLFGCSTEHLKQHIESKFLPGMNWINSRLWHIDHVKPCSSFDLSKKEQLEACFNFNNLQPLWKLDNLKKGDKY